jgi:predicted acetyltransferase
MNYSIKLFKTVPKDVNEQIKMIKHSCFTKFRGETQVEISEHDDKFYNNKAVMNIIALTNNAVIGYTGVMKRKIFYNGMKIILGGFGGICVSPQYRRKGIASLMCEIGMKELFKLDCDIAYLCTDIKDPIRVHLYNKFGFMVLNRTHKFTGKSGKTYLEYDAMIAPVKSRDMFNIVVSSSEILDIGKGNW